jgi:hypothetical protein
MITTEHITDFVSIELVNGVVIGTLKCEYVDLSIAQAAVSHRLKHFGNKDYLMIVNMSNVKHITKEAREYLASEIGCSKVKCCAIIISSEVTKIIANFFVRINKPLVPTSIFTSEEKARQWLSSCAKR